MCFHHCKSQQIDDPKFFVDKNLWFCLIVRQHEIPTKLGHLQYKKKTNHHPRENLEIALFISKLEWICFLMPSIFWVKLYINNQAKVQGLKIYLGIQKPDSEFY